ncbi:hypothetical protein LXL04_009780 [Taraxacum kok-saghyz]
MAVVFTLKSVAFGMPVEFLKRSEVKLARQDWWDVLGIFFDKSVVATEKKETANLEKSVSQEREERKFGQKEVASREGGCQPKSVVTKILVDASVEDVYNMSNIAKLEFAALEVTGKN